ncbi:MAG: quinone-dependent dihydroorotate dehydrogenase [Balneolaceae bacterium]|nr:quinone-dependent dihydroorotate dehydrogenase [Balneolaceae bacterium]
MYKQIVRPLLFRFSSDYAHEATIKFAAAASKSPWMLKATRSMFHYSDPVLEQHFFGLTFPNPIGLAAGFDKNGTTIPIMQNLGFGFVEIGSITANPSTGNPKPRSFRLPKDKSLINRMGLNNDGVQTISRRLKKAKADIPIGANIAKTHNPSIVGEKAILDYKTSFDIVKNLADYVTINISCPNTTEGKTFEDPESLDQLLSALGVNRDASLPAVFVKFSVDLSKAQLKELVEICEKHAVDGYVATNTSSKRENLSSSERVIKNAGNGGLSGQAIKHKSTELIEQIYSLTNGQKKIIGVGGVSSTIDAIEKLMAGADLLQIYTGLVYEGPGLVRKINRELTQFLKNAGVDHIYHIRKIRDL